MPTGKQNSKHQAMLDSFDNFAPAEQSVLLLLSVIYDVISRSNLISCMKAVGYPDVDGHSIDNSTLSSMIQAFVKQGLVIQTGKGIVLNELLAEPLSRRLAAEGSFKTISDKVELLMTTARGWSDSFFYRSYGQGLRNLRVAIFTHDTERAHLELERITRQFAYQTANEHPLAKIVCNPFEEEWLQSLPDSMRAFIIWTLLATSVSSLTPADEIFGFLLEHPPEPGRRYTNMLRQSLAEQYFWRDRFAEARTFLDGDDSVVACCIRARMDLFSGDLSSAARAYRKAVGILKKHTKKRKPVFETIDSYFYILTLIKLGEPADLKEALEYCHQIQKISSFEFSKACSRLEALIQGLLGDMTMFTNLQERLEWEVEFNYTGGSEYYELHTFFEYLPHFWLSIPKLKKWLPRFERFFHSVEKSGYRWLAAEVASCCSSLEEGKGKSKWTEKARHLRVDQTISPLVEMIHIPKAWERSIKALIALKDRSDVLPGYAASRMAWMVEENFDGYKLCPREQKLGQNGRWSKGRRVSLKRLYEEIDAFPYLSDPDRRICEAIIVHSESNGYYGRKNVHAFSNELAFRSLVGHPCVYFDGSPPIPVEVVRGQAELRVLDRGEFVAVELYPSEVGSAKVLLHMESPTRLSVIEVSDSYRHISDIVGSGVEVPMTHKDIVLDAISSVSNLVTIQSDIGGGIDKVEDVEGDKTLHGHLVPYGEGLKLQILIRPFGEGGTWYHPASGGETVIADVAGKRLRTRRDLNMERESLAAIVAACPTLQKYGDESAEWIVAEIEDCLEMLLELRECGDRIVIAWPQGEKLRIGKQVSFDQLSIRVRKKRNWFEASGELKLDEDMVLDMKQLLPLVAKSKGRFIPLGDGEFIAMTRAFRNRLKELEMFSEDEDGNLLFHPLAALGLEEISDQLSDFESDKAWKEHFKRLRATDSTEVEVPSTLTAELRDYQIEGFRWLCRLADWGAGACLADDMGLGKTIQSLTFFLTRADRGPIMVVAPKSVCMNWEDEIIRFTPSLRPILFGPEDRKEVLEALEPFDILICSYGLLQQESEILSEVNWQVVLLDEAQAIKNMATKRSKAAMGLKAEFKMLTTGTPIENHLGEFWNLLHFINPGLLGSIRKFNERFAIPIEKHQDGDARRALKKLVRPFVLRRLKSEVLEELPPRTEVLLKVDLSEEESALYEAMRRSAVEKLSESSSPIPQRNMLILGEIMKLRRLCCHPRLVAPQSKISSSKLELFAELVDDLIENRHKALVFSQFVGHLKIVREYLDQRGIHYQYLDGSTSAKARKKGVSDFQSGKGELFLISLKAGGLGLNLTAADYVIHLDPWWNPAVEDQASDRAHRIGQLRPVTIYRMVARNTIEDKIVDLHRHKRDLADSLLEGTDMSGKISTQELLELLKGV